MSLLHPKRALPVQHKELIPIDHPNLSVTRAKLEYPTVDVPLLYLYAIGKAEWKSDYDLDSLVTSDAFADR